MLRRDRVELGGWVVAVVACASVVNAATSVVGAVQAPAPASATEPRTIGTPTTVHILEFDQTVIELGPVSDEAPITTVFHFTNTSDKAVRLSIDGCHLCGLPTSDKESYGPGERGAIFVVFEPFGKKGVKRAGGGIGVKGVHGSVVNLEVVAEVRPRLCAEPEEVMVNDLVVGKGAEVVVSVISRGAEGFKVERAQCEQAGVGVSIGDARRVEDGGDVRTVTDVRVSVAPDVPEGEHAGTVRVMTNDSKRPEIAIPVHVRVVGNLVAEPGELALGVLNMGEVFDGKFVVKRRNGAAATVRSIDVVDPGACTAVAVDWIVDEAGARAVRITGRAPDRPMQLAEVKVRIECAGADGKVESVVVPVRLSVRMAR
jgi:hypothetical protein